VSRIVIACPKGVVTGGPEALHQLGAAIRSLGVDTYLWDPNADSNATKSPYYFSQYEVNWTHDSPRSGDTVIIPEVMGDLVPRYYSDCLCIFWWLSVDNFFASNKLPLEVLLQLFPKVIHASQSQYAKDFLQKNGVTEVLPLTDYINKDFILKRHELFNLSVTGSRIYDVAINPQKGLERSLRVIAENKGLRIVQLQDMTRDEVIQALTSSKIYLDLGNHPGTDRIPREAALLGCVVITNFRGSAGNEIDVPLNRELFKRSDEQGNFELEIAKTLRNMLAVLDEARLHQHSYAEWILDAPNRFQKEVSNLLKAIDSKTVNISDVEKLLSKCVTLAYPERDQLLVERDAVVRERDQLLVERDAVVRERDAVVKERDQLLVERDAVVRERDHLRKERNQLTRQLNAVKSEIQAIKRSLFWRTSTPIRVLANHLKKWLP